MLEWWHTVETMILSATGSPWALVILFFLAIGDGAIPPLPSETFLSALAAAAVTSNSIKIHLILLVGAAGALTGDMMMYGIGRLVPIPFGSRRDRLIRGLDRKVHKSWPVLLGMARFIPVVRVAIFLAAGAKRIDWRRVLIIDSLSALVWASWFTIAGFTGGVFLRSYPLLGILLGMAVGSLAGVLMGLVAKRVLGGSSSADGFTAASSDTAAETDSQTAVR